MCGKHTPSCSGYPLFRLSRRVFRLKRFATRRDPNFIGLKKGDYKTTSYLCIPANQDPISRAAGVLPSTAVLALSEGNGGVWARASGSEEL